MLFDTAAKLDRQMFNRLNRYGVTYRLNNKAKIISATGDGPFYLYLCVALLLLRQDGEQLFNIALAAFVVELPFYLILKNSIRRTRPCEQKQLASSIMLATDFKPSDKFSLPSGHTAAAFIMASAIAHVYPSMQCLAYSWVLLIGLSRIILGVHYPLDIVAGAVLGGTSFYLVLPLVVQ